MGSLAMRLGMMGVSSILMPLAKKLFRAVAKHGVMDKVTKAGSTFGNKSLKVSDETDAEDGRDTSV